MKGDEELELATLEESCEKARHDIKLLVEQRIIAERELAVIALRKLVKWVPGCGFPENITPAYCDPVDIIKDYREEQGLDDPEMRFCTEAYTYELWGKEDARTFLAYLGGIARALGLEGLHDRRLR